MIGNFLVVIFIVALILYLYNLEKEHYGEGALIQLMAKGPQDTYLTGDALKYMYYPIVYDPYYGYPYLSYGYPFFYHSGLRPKKSESIKY